MIIELSLGCRRRAVVSFKNNRGLPESAIANMGSDFVLLCVHLNLRQLFLLTF